jgi:CHAT domain
MALAPGSPEWIRAVIPDDYDRTAMKLDNDSGRFPENFCFVSFILVVTSSFSRVVASLWQALLPGTLLDGMRSAAALRAAQIELSKKPQWQSPFYWGAFVLQGEWK